MVYTVAVFYLVWKAIIWCLWDTLLVFAARKPVPVRSLAQLVELMALASPKPESQPTPYTGDLLGGLVDGYTSPKRFEAALTAPDPVAACKRLNIDCDDVAIFAKKTLENHPEVEWVKTVSMVGSGLDFKISHVICVGKLVGGRFFTFDTNGLIHHDQADSAYLMNYFGYAYKGRYATAVDSKAWFLL